MKKLCQALACVAVCVSASASAQTFEGQAAWLFPAWESLTSYDAANTQANLALLQQAQTLFAAQNIQLIYLLVPSKAVFYSERLPSDKALSPEIRTRLSTILDKMASLGLLAPDIRWALQALEYEKKLAFYRTDYHWTSDGSEAAALVAAQALLKTGVKLQGQAGTGAKLGEWRNEKHYGDLAERFLTSTQKAKIGRELFTVRVVNEAATSLLDDEPAPVHVMGNSFVQPYWGFSQRLSNALDRPVSLSWQVGNVGHWMNALKYAESEAFAQHRPQVIVWQMNEAQIQLGPNDATVWDAGSRLSADAWLQRLRQALTKK